MCLFVFCKSEEEQRTNEHYIFVRVAQCGNWQKMSQGVEYINVVVVGIILHLLMHNALLWWNLRGELKALGSPHLCFY